MHYVQGLLSPKNRRSPETTNANNTTRNLSITVKDSEDKSIQGATVTIGSTSKTTGSAGGCTLNNIPDGEQTISVTKTGYNDYSETITVSKENTKFTITLTESE